MRLVIKLKHTLSIAVLFCVSMACSVNKDKVQDHYFLDGYDHLEFRNQSGLSVPPHQYIQSKPINGVRVYEILDTSLILYDTRDDENYTGFIRTFHRDRNNLQGEFKDGKIFRLRFWDGRRTLRMDANYINQTGSAWYPSGSQALKWNAEEMYYYNGSSNNINRIITDTSTTFFDNDGIMTHYVIRSDTSYFTYNGDGTPRFFMQVKEGGIREGLTKGWHDNGQLQMIGQYKDGVQVGVWIQYDSLGNEVDREVYDR